MHVATSSKGFSFRKGNGINELVDPRKKRNLIKYICIVILTLGALSITILVGYVTVSRQSRKGPKIEKGDTPSVIDIETGKETIEKGGVEEREIYRVEEEKQQNEGTVDLHITGVEEDSVPDNPEAEEIVAFIRPCECGSILFRFGDDKLSSYPGIYIVDSGSKGCEIVASEKGTIVFADFGGSAGKSIHIEHENRYVTIYAHLADIYVSDNEEVVKGQEIGFMGKTGNATAIGLHFGMIYMEERVNPEDYIIFE